MISFYTKLVVKDFTSSLTRVFDARLGDTLANLRPRDYDFNMTTFVFRAACTQLALKLRKTNIAIPQARSDCFCRCHFLTTSFPFDVLSVLLRK